MRYLCLPTPVTYVPRLNTVRTGSGMSGGAELAIGFPVGMEDVGPRKAPKV
ncbi:hypothetical protein Pres01_24540 [Metapseudomonas resinovorans]|nr:hypothetical protein Pres01_24540 [Pseudomonas resinovorans]